MEVLDDTDHVKVGITEYAAEALGDVVFAQLPAVGDEVSKGAECGAVESVKAASDLYSPVSGTVINTNLEVRLEAVTLTVIENPYHDPFQLEDKPALINTSPEEEAWMFELKLANRIELRSLMDKDGYDKFLKTVTDDLQ